MDGFDRQSRTRSRPLSWAIIDAIADVEGIDVTELDFTLYEFVDPDVLEGLAQWGKSDWNFEFTVEDHAVLVDSSGSLIVDGSAYDWKRTRSD